MNIDVPFKINSRLRIKNCLFLTPHFDLDFRFWINWYFKIHSVSSDLDCFLLPLYCEELFIQFMAFITFRGVERILKGKTESENTLGILRTFSVMCYVMRKKGKDIPRNVLTLYYIWHVIKITTISAIILIFFNIFKFIIFL